MANLLCFFSFAILLIPTLSTIITKTVLLTPENNNINGVEVDVNNVDVFITPTAWAINVSSNNGWHLHISLNHSWNFLSDRQSTITLKTYTESSTNTPNKDIIFVFSQNSQKYISSTIQINANSSNNGIYPQCNPPYTSMADGDIDILLNNNDETTNREYKLTNGLNHQIIASNINTLNKSPLSIQLVNNPINKWSKWQYSNQHCQFEAFSTNHPLDIYISAADIGQILSINKLEITFEYDATVTRIKDKYKPSESASFFPQYMVGHVILIVILIVISITTLLFFVCIILILMVWKQSIRTVNNKKQIELQGITATEMILHTATFRNINHEISKNYSVESRTSFDGQFTDTSVANEDESASDDDVILDMRITIGK